MVSWMPGASLVIFKVSKGLQKQAADSPSIPVLPPGPDGLLEQLSYLVTGLRLAGLFRALGAYYSTSMSSARVNPYVSLRLLGLVLRGFMKSALHQLLSVPTPGRNTISTMRQSRLGNPPRRRPNYTSVIPGDTLH